MIHLLAFTLTTTFAMPKFLVALHDQDNPSIIELEDRLRLIAEATGTGEVTKHPTRRRYVVDMSEQGAARARALPGVTRVFPALDAIEDSPSMQAREDRARYRLITLEIGIASDLDALTARIRDLSRETASGYCDATLGRYVVADLTREAVRTIMRMDGVRGVEDYVRTYERPPHPRADEL